MKDIIARSFTKFFRFFADAFFAKRYGHRAVVLETVAGVPSLGCRFCITFKEFKKDEGGI